MSALWLLMFCSEFPSSWLSYTSVSRIFNWLHTQKWLWSEYAVYWLLWRVSPLVSSSTLNWITFFSAFSHTTLIFGSHSLVITLRIFYKYYFHLIWFGLTVLIAPVVNGLFVPFVMLGAFGFSFHLAILSDLLVFISLHAHCFYIYVAV